MTLPSMSTSSAPPRLILPKPETGLQASSSQHVSSSSELSPTKRQCVSSACIPCRRRRSKCDGEKPTCAACTSVYYTHCEYDIDGDRRRKSALKRDIHDLTDQKDNFLYILTSIRNGAKSDVEAVVDMIRSNQGKSFESISQMIRKLKETSVSGSPVTEHFVEIADEQYDNSKVPSLHASPGTQVGVWTQLTNDASFAKHLLDLYFTWSHPFYVLFSEELFCHSLQDRKLKYATPLLLNAVLAVGCHYSDLPASRAVLNDSNTAGDHFFAEAERLLDVDCRSSLTTVAALGVMSIRQSMKGDNSGGLEYARQMMSMSAELCLHMDPPSLDSFKDMTIPEVEARRVTFWGTYAVETTSTMCLGRISGLSRTAVRIEKPCPNHLESKVWKPHGHPLLVNRWLGLEQASFTYSLARQLGYLTDIVNDTGHLLYATRDRTVSRKLRQLHERYESWHRSVPEVLSVKGGMAKTLPQVIALHIYYYSCLIQLFRPFVRVRLGPGSKTPNMITTEAAIALSNLLELYKNTYDLTHVFLVMAHAAMTAGMQHLFDLSSQTHSVAAQASLYLRDAIQALHTMKRTIPASALYLQVLADLVKAYAPNPPEHVSHALLEAGVVASSPPYITEHVNTSVQGMSISQPEMQMLDFSSMTQADPIISQDMSLPFSSSLESCSSSMPGASQGTGISDMLSSTLNGDLAQLHQGVLALGAAGSDVNVDIDIETWSARQPGT